MVPVKGQRPVAAPRRFDSVHVLLSDLGVVHHVAVPQCVDCGVLEVRVRGLGLSACRHAAQR